MGWIKNNSRRVVGIGSALIDILVHEDDDFLKKAGGVKGGMIYVDKDYIEHILTLTSSEPRIVPGGSACNTIVGISRLGGEACFVGKSGNDAMGIFYETNLKASHVEPTLFKSSSPTGRVLSIITPDAQRSMFTFLGAASEIQPEEITNDCFSNAAVVHIEGYIVFNEDLIMAALNAAKGSGACISLDLASFTVVKEAKPLLDKIVATFVDILMANEDEALAFTGCSDEDKALDRLAENVQIAVLKLGERGSYISQFGKRVKIDPFGTGVAIDTTGAGDLWASGFLFGLVNGYDIKSCGRIGSACGYEVCQVVGANIPPKGWQRIKKILEE